MKQMQIQVSVIVLWFPYSLELIAEREDSKPQNKYDQNDLSMNITGYYLQDSKDAFHHQSILLIENRRVLKDLYY